MVSRILMQQTNRLAITWSTVPGICRAGSLFLLLLSSLTLAAQQPHHSATVREAEASSKPSANKPSANLQQAEELRRKGLFDQAKDQVLKELESNPASVE